MAESNTPAAQPVEPLGPRLTVIIPVYNEQNTIGEIIRRVRLVPLAKEILVVDDGSSDGTQAALAALAGGDLRVFRHGQNRGKGAALRTAFAQVTGQIVIIQDADLEYDPAEYPALIRPIAEGLSDVVYGSRFLGGGSRQGISFWHWAANRLVTALSNLLTGLRLTDIETCYKVFRREVIAAVAPALNENRFGIDPELTAKIARRKFRICERPTRYRRRGYREGKKIGLCDALRILWCIVRYGIRD